MRTLSNLWTTLAAQDTTVLETVAVINGTQYSAITAPIIRHSLLSSDELTVGNCIAASLSFTVMTTNTIPKSASVVIKSRLVNGQQYTSWYEFGTFYVSKRKVDDDLVTLECYDAMLKGNQAYGGSNDAMNWPKPMQTVLNTIASRMGVSLDSRTSIRSDSTTYKCEYPGDMTLLEVLGHIGACNGGNWIITPENKLRLVPLTGSGNTVNVTAVLSQITTSKSYSISGVTMVLDEDHVYSAGNSTGYVLTINPNPYACQTIVNNLYNALNGLAYQPFTIAGAIYNPAAELGDTIVIGDIQSKIFSETLSFDISFRADAAAPAKDEMEDEYPYPSEIKRLQQSTVELKNNDIVLSSRITQTQTDITLEVSRAQGAEDTLSSRISQNATDISLRVEKSGVIAAINLSTESSGGSAIKISADKVNLSGYATFTSLSTAGQTSINGANIQTGTITATQLSVGVNNDISTAQSTADGASSQEQLIYISKASGTTTVSSNTTWVTNTTGNQNTWTTKRPVYNSSYPVLFVATQRQTVAQKKAGSTCSCTTPTLDQTTTVIDGGSITTGYLSASRIKGGTLNLGGGNAYGNGELKIYNSSSTLIGSWTKDGISINAGSINIGNGAFSVNSSGELSATGATINGELYAANSNGSWLDIEYGCIKGGDSSGYEDGRILFGSYAIGASGGVYLNGDSIFLDCYNLYTNYYNFDHSAWELCQTFSGTIRFITNIWDNGNGVSWTWTDYRFENGLLLN